MGSRYPPRDRDYSRARYNHYPPPPPPRDRSPPPPPPPPGVDSYIYHRHPPPRDHRKDHYEPDSSHDRYDGGSYRQYAGDRNSSIRGSYTFRGASDRNAYSRPEESFTFQARQGPPAPRFPSAQEQPLPSRPQRRNDTRRPMRAREPPIGNKNRDAQKPRRFAPRPAHSRDLLTRTTRDTTPEQLAGMNGAALPRFREVNESPISVSSDDEDDEMEVSNKRRKVQSEPEPTMPKWSNPDPYTALPPIAQVTGPKKDIVDTIRKAKIDSSQSAIASNPVKENVDFISFNDDNDDGEDEQDEDEDELDGNVAKHIIFGASSRGAKRKHSEISPDELLGGVVDPDWVSNGIADPTPWCSDVDTFTSNVGLMLHKEIADFYEWVRPSEVEEVVRQDLVRDIQYAIQGWPHGRGVQVHSFGSFPAGLYLPDADMDLVVLSESYMQSGRASFCQKNKDMFKLRDILQRASIIDRGKPADVITKARVPLLKFFERDTGLKIDISFENYSGVVAQTTLKNWRAQFPDMPVLVALVKQFLAMRNLNEVFQGGIGGFTIICLVVSMLQHMPESQSGNLNPNTHYGDLLLNFLDLYGNKFDYRSTGIIMDPPSYFDKTNDRARIGIRYQDDRLTIIDPNNKDNDISGGSRLIEEVFDCFRGAHSLVQRRLADVHKGKTKTRSILECVIGGNYASYARRRSMIRAVHDRSYPGARPLDAVNRPAAVDVAFPIPPRPFKGQKDATLDEDQTRKDRQVKKQKRLEGKKKKREQKKAQKLATPDQSGHEMKSKSKNQKGSSVKEKDRTEKKRKQKQIKKDKKRDKRQKDSSVVQ